MTSLLHTTKIDEELPPIPPYGPPRMQWPRVMNNIGSLTLSAARLD